MPHSLLCVMFQVYVIGHGHGKHPRIIEKNIVVHNRLSAVLIFFALPLLVQHMLNFREMLLNLPIRGRIIRACLAARLLGGSVMHMSIHPLPTLALIHQTKPTNLDG